MCAHRRLRSACASVQTDSHRRTLCGKPRSQRAFRRTAKTLNKDVQVDMNICLAHMQSCWKCCTPAKIINWLFDGNKYEKKKQKKKNALFKWKSVLRTNIFIFTWISWRPVPASLTVDTRVGVVNTYFDCDSVRILLMSSKIIKTIIKRVWNGKQRPGVTLRIRRIIWICAFCTCSETLFRLTRPIYRNIVYGRIYRRWTKITIWLCLAEGLLMNIRNICSVEK